MTGLPYEFYDLDDAISSIAASGVSGVVYALTFDEDGNALELDSGKYKFLNAFEKSNQRLLAIQLVQSTERTRQWSKNIAAGSVEVSATDYGEYITNEYWIYTGGIAEVGTNVDRDIDTLVKTEKIIWSGTRVIDSHLGLDQEQFNVFTSSAYYSGESKLRTCIWLEKNGRKITDATSARIVIRKRDDTAALDKTVLTKTSDGSFIFEEVITALSSDEVYTVTAYVTDANGRTYNSGNSFCVWD